MIYFLESTLYKRTWTSTIWSWSLSSNTNLFSPRTLAYILSHFFLPLNRIGVHGLLPLIHLFYTSIFYHLIFIILSIVKIFIKSDQLQVSKYNNNWQCNKNSPSGQSFIYYFHYISPLLHIIRASSLLS